MSENAEIKKLHLSSDARVCVAPHEEVARVVDVVKPKINTITLLSRDAEATMTYKSSRMSRVTCQKLSRCSGKGRNPHKQTSWKLVGNPGRELVAN